MAILSSSRNLLLFGGLGVFALGWGGGLLLGVFQSPDQKPARPQPKLVDADEYSPADGQVKAEERSSSLLEQVFGLDDLEEEKPPPRKNPKVDSQKVASPPSTAAREVDLANKIMLNDAAVEPVQLEETPAPALEKVAPTAQLPKEDVQTAPAEGGDTKPPKSIFDENPYK